MVRRGKRPAAATSKELASPRRSHRLRKTAAATPTKKPRPPSIQTARQATSLLDVLAVAHPRMLPFLSQGNLKALLSSLELALTQDLRDAVATAVLRNCSCNFNVHFGAKCVADWHQLMPEKLAGAGGGTCACSWDGNGRAVIPQDLPLPTRYNTRTMLLLGVYLILEGIHRHCYRVLQTHLGFGAVRYGSFQPMIFSLVAALEQQQEQKSVNKQVDKLRVETGKLPMEKGINIDDVEQLTRLMSSLELGFGTRFFTTRRMKYKPIGIVEAHWRGINVDLDADSTACEFCEKHTMSMFLGAKRSSLKPDQYLSSMRQHCQDVYQPLKKFMMRNLKHVRYVRPPHGWNRVGGSHEGGHFLDLIAGFIPGGVLCGVYLTDTALPRKMAAGKKRRAAKPKEPLPAPQPQHRHQVAAHTAFKSQRIDRSQPKMGSMRLPDVVTLLHTCITPFLAPDEVMVLENACGQTVSQQTREAMATDGLKGYFRWHHVHFGKRCLHNARRDLLSAVFLAHEGLVPFCYKVLGMHLGLESLHFGSMQPVVFSLVAAQEKQREQMTKRSKKSSNMLNPEAVDQQIDIDDVQQLTRLMDSLEVGFGTRFFSTRARKQKPRGIVEAHWRGIVVDMGNSTTRFDFCENHTQSFYVGRKSAFLKREQYVSFMRQHCATVYQPLKLIMTRHLKHVRYVRPPHGWNRLEGDYAGCESLDLIAGFTPGGVLCGVYLTDICIPNYLIGSRLAAGAYDFQFDTDSDSDSE
ncbi:hypothetical protein BBJ28_00022408 [Nothophytophthora sp. Chile5]|nr:hypothetical protein BBJ28_00022408 [Nothophytophthora sp. Chile5]